MGKHTPGPWQFDDRNWRGNVDTSGSLYVTGDHHECEATADDGTPVEDGWACTAVCKVEGNATAGEISTANARLIAAAPDLLAACKAADQFICNGIELGYIRMPDPETNDPASKTPGIIATAIAKATA